MSLTPESSPPVFPARLPDAPPPPGHERVWPRRVVQVALALFTFEIGLFLAVFPWTEYWSANYFQEAIPSLHNLWDQPSFRGFLTGLGLVNIYLACLQVVHAFRRSRG